MGKKDNFLGISKSHNLLTSLSPPSLQKTKKLIQSELIVLFACVFERQITGYFSGKGACVGV